MHSTTTFRTDAPPPYAELVCLSNFTFLQGASHPQELVARAVQLGYRALALTDVLRSITGEPPARTSTAGAAAV